MKNEKKDKCSCPYCEKELKHGCIDACFCNGCNMEFIKCPKCGQLFSKELKKCPQCG